MLPQTPIEAAAPITSREARFARVTWVEPIKALALAWIFFNHVAERLFGAPFFGNPDKAWPAMGERLAQLHALANYGIWNLPLTIARDVAWLGDQGVTLFLILSGFGLAWGRLERSGRDSLHWGAFYRRRLSRIFPMWIMAHICFLLPLAVLGWRLSLLDSQLYWSLLGVRVLPNQLYYGVAAWWYVTLLLQLYVIFPLLWTTLQRAGETKFLALTLAVALPIRAAGLFSFHDYLDAWSRGAIFISRLPEFALGVAAGAWYFSRSHENERQLSRTKAFLSGLLLFGAGTVASFSLAGMTIAPVVSGAGALLLFYSLFAGTQLASTRKASVLDWIGRHSLSLFLVHQIFVQLLIPTAAKSHSVARVLAGLVLASVFTVAAALILERLAEGAWNGITAGVRRFGSAGFTWRLAGSLGIAWALLIAVELTVRHFDPQEPWDLGWGERASLQPDDFFGWKMKPSQTTRLRWQSYDYRVTSNSLGFPGPEYPVQKQPGIFRVLVTGDAFTSAEGVDTGGSWPRLLENDLNRAGRRSQVLDFAITGYGPNQYDAVVERFAPKFHPDVIVIGLFVNDYGDALISNADFQREIGFGKADPNGWASILTFRHLGALARESGVRLVYRLLRKPDPGGYFFGQFHFLEKDNPEIDGAGRTILADRLRNIKTIADRVGARVLIAMIPAAPQVCGAESLSYWPKRVDVSDVSEFDMDLPQHATATIAESLSLATVDLRTPLKHAGGCPYQPQNMHWTPLGHRVTAEYVAETLKQEAIAAN